MGKLNRTMSILPTYAGGRPGGGQQPEVSVAGLVWHETTNCPSWSRGAQASGCSAGLHKGITSTSQGGGPAGAWNSASARAEELDETR